MRIRFNHHHPSGTVIFTAPVYAMRVKDRAPIVDIPLRIRSLKFPPFDGKRFVTIDPSQAIYV